MMVRTYRRSSEYIMANTNEAYNNSTQTELSLSEQRVFEYWRHVVGNEATALELARLAYHDGGRRYYARKAAVLGVSLTVAMTAGRGQ
jgi:hypothetical protein